MEEVNRITKSGETVKIIAPYFRSNWVHIDPTNLTFYTVDSFTYSDPRHIIYQSYDCTPARFLVAKIAFNETLENS
jgi:hypothetical protein